MLRIKKGFTLIELLVVISIIAVLMAIMMPALSKVREQAKLVICGTNQHQFSLAFSLYATENNGKLMPYQWKKQVKYFWMESLRSSYGDSDKLKLCPSVKTDYDKFGGDTPYGSAKRSWHFLQQYQRDVIDDYGSYGINGWMYDANSKESILPGSDAPGGYGDKSMYWSSLNIKNASQVPLFLECAWVDGWPLSTDQPPVSGDGEIRNIVPGNSGSEMSKFCFDRHNNKLNICFADLSVQKTEVEDLWNLKWNRRFDKRKLESSELPDWMR